MNGGIKRFQGSEHVTALKEKIIDHEMAENDNVRHLSQQERYEVCILEIASVTHDVVRVLKEVRKENDTSDKR